MATNEFSSLTTGIGFNFRQDTNNNTIIDIRVNVGEFANFFGKDPSSTSWSIVGIQNGRDWANPTIIDFNTESNTIRKKTGIPLSNFFPPFRITNNKFFTQGGYEAGAYRPGTTYWGDTSFTTAVVIRPTPAKRFPKLARKWDFRFRPFMFPKPLITTYPLPTTAQGSGRLPNMSPYQPKRPRWISRVCALPPRRSSY